jgi:hypothetical protein
MRPGGSDSVAGGVVWVCANAATVPTANPVMASNAARDAIMKIEDLLWFSSVRGGLFDNNGGLFL